MIPILPTLDCDLSSIDIDNYTRPKTYQKMEPFSLFIISPILLNIPRIYVDSRYVIVGASNVAISLLITLFYEKPQVNKLLFNDITLVSKYLINEETNSLGALMFVRKSLIDANKLQEIPLNTYCNIVKSTVVHIDRKNKNLVLDNGTILVYEKLILTCGKQFHRRVSRKNITKEVPLNLFTINSMDDAQQALDLTLRSYEKALDENPDYGM